MATFLTDSRRKKYIINIPLVAILTRTAIAHGAEPYGLGLWNVPLSMICITKQNIVN